MTSATTLKGLAGMAPPRRVTLCVDDFGQHDGVNSAALILSAMGRLGATSVLVDGPAVRDGAEMLLDAAARTSRAARGAGPDIGLHLNLSETMPGRTFPSAAPVFACDPLRKLVVKAYARVLQAATVAREIHRQCDAFERLFKRRPDHVDGHQHVHQLPVVRDALLQVLSERYGAARPWLRSTRPPRGMHTTKALVIAGLGQRRLVRQALRAGFASNSHLLGVHDFTMDPLAYEEKVAQWIAASTHGDVLMCHPSTFCAARDPLLRERMAEHEVLTGFDFERRIRDAGVTLGRFAG